MSATSTQSYILFAVAGTSYALPSEQVLHIEMVEHVTPVPNAPPFIEGVVFSRGQVVPVINLRARFGFDRAPLDARARLLVVQHQGRRVGLLADDAREFIRIDPASIHPPAEAISGLSGNYVAGIATLGDRIVLVLDFEEIIATTPTTAA